MADFTLVEVRGAAEELDKLRKLLAHLNPRWLTLEASVMVSKSRKRRARANWPPGLQPL